MNFISATESVVRAIEVAGILVIVIGMVVALLYAANGLARDRSWENAYTRVRHGVGRALLLGLDLLIASEIIRSIVAESLETTAALGLTIVIRTFLSLTLTIEIEGELPWRRGHALDQSRKRRSDGDAG